MLTICTSCSGCGAELELPLSWIVVGLPAAPDDDARGEVLHGCPDCPSVSRMLVASRDLARLVAAQVSALPSYDLESLHPPHPEQSAGGPPLTYDDLLELHRELAADSWLDAVSGEQADRT
jgi:hypothetical protein